MLRRLPCVVAHEPLRSSGQRLGVPNVASCRRRSSLCAGKENIVSGHQRTLVLAPTLVCECCVSLLNIKQQWPAHRSGCLQLQLPFFNRQASRLTCHCRSLAVMTNDCTHWMDQKSDDTMNIVCCKIIQTVSHEMLGSGNYIYCSCIGLMKCLAAWPATSNC